MLTSSPNPRVLVIDDYEPIARVFARVLAGAGYTVETALSAEAGLQQVQTQAPDLIVLDIKMPFVNGLGFLYRLRALPGHLDTPVLVATGAPLDEPTTEELRTLGAAVRYKPVEKADLVAIVAAMLAERRMGHA
jgi:CheY-like chemotaxis protein